MVPRAEIEAINVDDSVQELHALFVSTGMSKLLTYKDSIDNIIGYVHGYELFRHPKSIKAVMRPVNFIPGTMPADEVLQLFIKQRNHVAVVVDEFGGTAGMVTMEDVVETIVGDIEDEHDTPEDVQERLGPTEFLFSARMEVPHLRETHLLAIPESEEYDTLAGYIHAQHGRNAGPGPGHRSVPSASRWPRWSMAASTWCASTSWTRSPDSFRNDARKALIA